MTSLSACADSADAASLDDIATVDSLSFLNALDAWQPATVTQVLMEAQQTLPDGRVRRRALPLSEKLVAGEEWRIALPRAIQEELGSVLGPTALDRVRATGVDTAFNPSSPPVLG